MPRDQLPVFVYGTLTDPERVDGLLDEWAFDGDAVLDGCHRVEGEHPTLAPGGRVAGRLLVAPALDALDAYEGVASGLYVRESVPVAGGEPEARRGAERNGGGEPSEPRRGSSDRTSDGGEPSEPRRGSSDRTSDGGEAWLYVGDPARLGAPASWPGDGSFASRVRAYLDDRAVVVRRTDRGAGRRPADR